MQLKKQGPLVFLSVVLMLVFLAGCSDTAGPAAGAGSSPAGAKAGEAVKEKTISQGERIRIEDHLVSGKTVIFDFYSDGCPPCRRLSPILSKLAEKRPDIALVKVDINRPGTGGIDWQSPVAQQFELSSIPHLKVYSPEGKLEAEGKAAMEIVGRMIDEEGIQ
ncbi:MAG: thioredoxin family protein [Acidobacteria bacterium]|nr:thioredoxin family protein [Acidobacteriota bacterium]